MRAGYGKLIPQFPRPNSIILLVVNYPLYCTRCHINCHNAKLSILKYTVKISQVVTGLLPEQYLNNNCYHA